MDALNAKEATVAVATARAPLVTQDTLEPEPLAPKKPDSEAASTSVLTTKSNQESEKKKKAATRGQRQRAVEAKGLETKQLLERPNNLTRQAKDSTDLNRRDTRNKASANSYAKSGKKKENGGAGKYCLQGKYLKYIPKVKTLLEQSLLFLGKVFAERHIPVDIETITFYWDLLCKRELKRGRKYIMMDRLKVREPVYVDNNPNSRIKYARVEYDNIRASLCETEGCPPKSVKIKSEQCELVVSETDMKRFQTLKVQTKTHQEFVKIILEEFYQRIENVSPQLLVVKRSNQSFFLPRKRSNQSQATPCVSPVPTTKKQKALATVTPDGGVS